MKLLLSQILGAFDAPREPRRGVVHRIGPWIGPAQGTGLVLMLEGDATCYVVLRDNERCLYPAGLTAAGDTVAFKAAVDGTVSLSSFRNLTLDAREHGAAHS